MMGGDRGKPYNGVSRGMIRISMAPCAGGGSEDRFYNEFTPFVHDLRTLRHGDSFIGATWRQTLCEKLELKNFMDRLNDK